LKLRAAVRTIPTPKEGELLVRVSAAGVTPSEKVWFPTTHQPDGTPRSHAIPAHELSGTVEALGPGATGFKVGDAVFGFNDWFAEGAVAEFCTTKPANLSLKPSSLSFVQAASVPIGLLTAWQGLHVRARLQKGERVLIHGAAGAVGLFAVQVARMQGAHVIATASGTNVGVVKELGADEVIDYRQRPFEEAGKVDVVFDTVGGETLARSWDLLASSGRLVTIAADAEPSSDTRVKDSFFIVEQDGGQLAALAELFDTGKLKPFVKGELPMEEADRAYSSVVFRSTGKVVLRIT